MNEVFIDLYVDNNFAGSVLFFILPRIGECIKYNDTLCKVVSIIHTISNCNNNTCRTIDIYVETI